MTAFTEKLDRAAAVATCAVLEIGGASLIGSGVVGLAAGGTGVVPLAAGAAAVMASNFLGCQGWDPNQGEPSTPFPPNDFCYEGASDFQIRSLVNGQVSSESTPEVRKLTDVVYVETETDLNNDTYNVYRFEWVQSNGVSGSTSLREGGGTVNTWVFRQDFVGDPTCEVPGPKPPVVDIPPFDYTDPEDGCELTVNFQGFASGGGGNVNPVFKIEPNAATRAESDVIGGCNFQPVIYMGDPNGGPPYVGPWNPDWDQPDSPPFEWEDQLRDIASICGNEDVISLLNQLLVDPLSGILYALNSVCELDEQGNPKVVTVKRQIPELSPLLSIATRLDALVPLLQAQKDFKQPVCPPVKAQGDIRTIGFISENYSPNGRNYLRKRVRYRSVSGLGLNELIDYWKDFEFDAGPVIVKHVGSSWGTVTVWAASIAEGKRVIRHAAGEASVDADQVGRWEICSSTSSRLGMPGRMKVNQAGGYYWITARDGSDARPMVGTI